MTDPLGQSQVLPYIIGLTKEGHEFHIISFEKMDRFKEHRGHISEICKKNNIHWHPQDYHLEGGLKKTLKQVKQLNKVAEFLQERHQFDLVHSRSYISALTAVRLKKKYGVPFVFDMRGFWADERVDGGLWNLSSPIYKAIYNYFKKKEIKFLKEAGYTISLTENGKNEILSWEKVPKDLKIKVIPCCVDLDLFDPKNFTEQDKNELKKALNIPAEAFILGYVGSIGTWYMLPEMLDYFVELRKSKPNAIFLFVTKEPKEMILDLAKEKGLPEEAFVITSSLHQDVPKHIALFDTSIFFIRPTYSKKASSPTKQGEIMAMGIPLICNAGIGDTDRIVNKYHSGEVIQDLNPTVYAEHMIDKSKFNRQEIMSGAQSYFALQEGVKRYLEVYREVYGN